jgi:hypothetical protein
MGAIIVFKVRVIAGSFEQTSKVLSDFKGQLPVDASMKQISIKHHKIYKHTFCRPFLLFRRHGCDYCLYNNKQTNLD